MFVTVFVGGYVGESWGSCGGIVGKCRSPRLRLACCGGIVGVLWVKCGVLWVKCWVVWAICGWIVGNDKILALNVSSQKNICCRRF